MIIIIIIYIIIVNFNVIIKIFDKLMLVYNSHNGTGALYKYTDNRSV